MLSVIRLAGYLVSRQSAFDMIGTVTSSKVLDVGPASSTAPQPVTIPCFPAYVGPGHELYLFDLP